MSKSEPQPPTIIPPPPAPDVGKTAGESFAAQLQYNPQLTEQQVQLQGSTVHNSLNSSMICLLSMARCIKP